ncbi:GNAT family N-acetyltransferase [Streptomyces sp. NPDC048187]|uniref:GNAT family N-acetyltransferase n=1 Tax=Streptomyces sp. NPDC048187 TaxID=3365509 RepID=UPI003712F067
MSSPSSPSHTDVTTERLVLRSWTRNEVTEVLGNTRSVHWAADFPAEGDRVIAGLLDQHPDWFGAYGHRLVVEREHGSVVGSIGLFWPPSDGVLEIGYGIVASHRGRDYATEATRALTEFALTAAEVHTVSATVELSNPASVRVLEKSGFRRWTTAGNTARFRRTRPEARRH